MPRLVRRLLNLLVGIGMLVFSGLAIAAPPTRVACLGYLAGVVGFSPGGENDWMQATLIGRCPPVTVCGWRLVRGRRSRLTAQWCAWMLAPAW